jgi:hypothetical protein
MKYIDIPIPYDLAAYLAAVLFIRLLITIKDTVKWW